MQKQEYLSYNKLSLNDKDLFSVTSKLYAFPRHTLRNLSLLKRNTYSDIRNLKYPFV